MREKTLEELSEPIELKWSFINGGYDCGAFPRYVDIWQPKVFFQRSCIELDGDDFTILTNQGTARYKVIKRVSDKWWIAELVGLVEPDE